MSNVTQERVDEILAAIKKAEPEMEIIGRDEKDWHKKHWQLWFIWLAMRILDVIRPSFAKRWRERYTVITTKHIAFPKMPENMRSYSKYSTLRHEYIHLRDRKKHPIWMPLSYALLFPAVWTMRAHWELRGYTATMLVRYEETGEIPDSVLDFIEEQFTTDRYVWMWPFPKKVRARLNQIRQDILDGKISGLYF